MYMRRGLRLLFGSSLIGVGSFLPVQANIGLSPWTAFAMGLSLQTGYALGSMVVAISVGVIVIDLLLKEKIGIGTIINGFWAGWIMNLMEYTAVIPLQESFLPGVLLLLAGLFVLSLGMYFNISPGLGAGPRDTLMVAIGRRFSRAPIGVVRSCLEGAALFAGWIMGAKVGVGTIISVFGIGLILQLTFRALRFNVRAVKHESMAETLKALFIRSAAKPE